MKFRSRQTPRVALWSDHLFYLVVLALLVAITATFATLLDLLLQHNFYVIACDTAFYQNGLVNLIHGHGFRDSAYDGPNVLGNHTTLVLVLLAPIYALLPSPDTLFCLQVWGVYATAIPLYLLASEMTRKPYTAFFIALSVLPSSMFLDMALAPFHPETWMSAAILMSVYFYRRNHAIGYWLGFALAVSCNEQAALVYLGLGLAWILIDDGLAWRRRFGVFALAGGIGWLVFALCILMPRMHGSAQQQVLSYHYDNWGGATTGSQLALAILHDPVKTASMLFSGVRWFHLFELIGLPLLFVLASRQALIVLLPFPIFFLMKNQEFFLDFHAYYYQFAFIAAYLGLIAFFTRWDVNTRSGVSIFAGTIILNVAFFGYALCGYDAIGTGIDAPLSDAVHGALAAIPPEAGVYSPHRFSAYLSTHVNMVMGDLKEPGLDFDSMIDDEYVNTTVHPMDVTYIVSDLRNDQCGPRMLGYNPDTARIRADNVTNLVKSGEWKIVWSQEDVVILQRTGQ